MNTDAHAREADSANFISIEHIECEKSPNLKCSNCEICDNIFLGKTEYPIEYYNCDDCPVSFTQEQDLRKHQEEGIHCLTSATEELENHTPLQQIEIDWETDFLTPSNHNHTAPDGHAEVVDLIEGFDIDDQILSGFNTVNYNVGDTESRIYTLDKTYCEEGVEDYSCNYLGCERVFKRQQQLEEHKLTHTKAMEYQCEICGATFHMFSNLRRHTTSAHNTKEIIRCRWNCKGAFFLLPKPEKP